MPFHQDQIVKARIDIQGVCWITDPLTGDECSAAFKPKVCVPITNVPFDAVVTHSNLPNLSVTHQEIPTILTDVQVQLENPRTTGGLAGHGIHSGLKFPIKIPDNLLGDPLRFIAIRLSYLGYLYVHASYTENGIYEATAFSQDTLARAKNGEILGRLPANIRGLSNTDKATWYKCAVDPTVGSEQGCLFDLKMFATIDQGLPLVSSGQLRVYLRLGQDVSVSTDVKINGPYLNLSLSQSIFEDFIDEEKEFYAEVFKTPQTDSVSLAIWNSEFRFALIVSRAWRSRFNEIGLFRLGAPNGGIGNFDTHHAEAIWDAQGESFDNDRSNATVARVKVRIRKNKEGFFDVIEVTYPRGVRTPKENGELVHYLPATVSAMPRENFNNLVFRFSDPDGIGSGEAPLWGKTYLRMASYVQTTEEAEVACRIQETILPFIEEETKALISLKGYEGKWSVFTVHSLVRKNENTSENC